MRDRSSREKSRDELTLRLRSGGTGWAWLLMFGLVAFASSASAAELPQIDSPVTDLAHVLSPEKVQALDEQLKAHHTASGVQLAVLIIDTTDGEAIESYSLRAATACAAETPPPPCSR